MRSIGVLKNGGLKAAYAIRATQKTDAPAGARRCVVSILNSCATWLCAWPEKWGLAPGQRVSSRLRSAFLLGDDLVLDVVVDVLGHDLLGEQLVLALVRTALDDRFR